MARPRLDQPQRRLVRRAEDFYTPPPTMRPDAWDHIPPAERVIAHLEHVQQRRYPRPEGTLDVELIARIDAGRWVAQCPDPGCASAQVVSPADPRFWCVECMPDGWASVRFPEQPETVEQQCASQPTRQRFWWAEDDTAWNKPRARGPLPPKVQQVIEQQDTTPPPDAEPPPLEEGGERSAPRNAPNLGRR